MSKPEKLLQHLAVLGELGCSDYADGQSNKLLHVPRAYLEKVLTGIRTSFLLLKSDKLCP